MGGRVGAVCHCELSQSLMLPSARSQALPLVSLYASRELARGSANGTAAIFPFYSRKAGNPLPPHNPLSALSFTLYDLRTTSALQLLALVSEGGTERRAANLGANTNAQTRTFGFFQFARRKLRREALAPPMC